jgi:hypothetical protein
MNVYQKLNAAREEFHKRELKKSGHNKFANYYYFELGDFVIPALQIFKEVGLTSVISFNVDIAKMTIINHNKPEETIIITSPMSTAALKGCHEVQNLGAVQTYIRRYLWVAALEIVEHDALDSSEGAVTTIDVNTMADHIKAINDAIDEASLIKAYQAAYKACGTDKAWQKKIIGVKDIKKAALK